MSEIIVTKPRDKALVTRHNHLIEARYRLTLQEQRILLWLFSEIGPEDKDFKRYRVRIADLAKLIGISDWGGRLYREIAEVTGRLRKREIDLEDIGRNVTTQATWIASAEYHWNEGLVEICLAPALMPYLLDLKRNFTTVALKYAIGMKSAYAIRLYELLKQYQTIGSRVVTIADLRWFCGIGPKDYRFYKDLRVRIVDMARREINAKTDIAFEYEEIKEGRKVVALRFRITKNPRADTPDPLRDDPRLARLVTRLTAHGMAEEAARAIVQAHEPELVGWATTDLARRLKSKEKIENPAGWLRKAIEEDWRPQPTLFAQEQTLARENERKAERERLDHEAKTAEWRKADSAREKAAIMAFIDGLPEEERQAVEQGFREYLAGTVTGIVAKRFQGGDTWAIDPIIRGKALKYLDISMPIDHNHA